MPVRKVAYKVFGTGGAASTVINFLFRVKPALKIVATLITSSVFGRVKPALAIIRTLGTFVVPLKPGFKLSMVNAGTLTKPLVKVAGNILRTVITSSVFARIKPALAIIRTTLVMDARSTKETPAMNMVQVDFDLRHFNWVQAGTVTQGVGGNWTSIASMEGPADAGTAQIVQIGYPVSDKATGGWTPTPATPATLWDKIDENPETATDNVSTTAAGEFKVAIDGTGGEPPLSNPGFTSNHTLEVFVQSVGGWNVTIKLYQETSPGVFTLRASKTQAAPTADTLVSYTLTAAEAGAITDYSKLVIGVQAATGTAPVSIQVNRARLVIGDGSIVGTARLGEGLVLVSGVLTGSHATQSSRPTSLVIDKVFLDFFTRGTGILLAVGSRLRHQFRINLSPVAGQIFTLSADLGVHNALSTPLSYRLDLGDGANDGTGHGNAAGHFKDLTVPPGGTPVTWANIALVQSIVDGAILVALGLDNYYIDAVKLRVEAHERQLL
jgi:hypothetical protein